MVPCADDVMLKGVGRWNFHQLEARTPVARVHRVDRTLLFARNDAILSNETRRVTTIESNIRAASSLGLPSDAFFMGLKGMAWQRAGSV